MVASELVLMLTIWGLNLPGTPRATSARRGTSLLYFY